MKRLSETVVTGILAGIYLLLSVRYFPEDAFRTILETFRHIAGAAPFMLGLTLCIILMVKRLAGQQPARVFVCRLFLTLGILMEFLYGLQAFLAKGQA